MTKPAEHRVRPGFLLRLMPYAAPALVLLTIAISLLRYHQYSFFLPESAFLMGGAAAIGLLFGALSRLRPSTLEPSLMAVVLATYIFYRPEIFKRVAGVASELGERVGGTNLGIAIIGVGLFFAMVIVCWLLHRHLSTIVATIFGTIILGTIALPATTGGEPVERGEIPSQLADLPPLIHIVLDEHIGLAAMPPEIEESAAAAQAIRATYRDFALYERAYSRFNETHNALASLLNNERGAGVQELLDQHALGYTLKQSKWFTLLKAKGYAIKVYDTNWLDLCSEIAAVDACYTYPLHSPNAAQRSTLSASARLRLLLGELGLWTAPPLPGPMAAREAIERFKADIERAPRGVAYFVHVLLPHYGYLYSSDCALADPAEWRTQPGRQVEAASPAARLTAYKPYMNQLLCTDRIVRGILETLRSLRVYKDATIIVHGDHGSRIGSLHRASPAGMFSDRDLLDYFATILAIKTPGTTPGVREEPALLQEIFAEAFLGGPTERVAPGEVLIEELPDSFAARTLRWPGSPANHPSIDELSALRPSLDESAVP
jgi:hypothetical protein